MYVVLEHAVTAYDTFRDMDFTPICFFSDVYQGMYVAGCYQFEFLRVIIEFSDVSLEVNHRLTFGRYGGRFSRANYIFSGLMYIITYICIRQVHAFSLIFVSPFYPLAALGAVESDFEFIKSAEE